jgi:hydroxymethylglutaryl-CoA reductase
MSKSSRISGFYKRTIDERLELVKDFANLTDEDVELIKKPGSLPIDVANHMIENVIGITQIPIGIAVNFRINEKDFLIPMAIEEPSVVAACSNAAKMARVKGGFFTSSTDSIMIGQIQAVNVKDPFAAKMRVLKLKNAILNKANEKHRTTKATDLDVKVINTTTGDMVITELYIDCKDAMGANAVNSMCESVASIIERATGGTVLLRILSNLTSKRLARAQVVIDKDAVGGQEIVEGIVEAWSFASADPYRAATHNKGIMNGIDAVAIATCNDFRGLEAGAHAYAARTGHYGPLTIWEKDVNGDLAGSIEVPMAVGIIGGVTKVHPIAQICLKILGVNTASELGEVMAAVGLAQNLAALRALVAEGIQKGHMSLHARNIAMSIGATGNLIDIIADKMVEEGNVKADRAKELLAEIQ